MDDDFRLVSISCDPRNDTPDKLCTYADRLQASPTRWLFLTCNDLDYIKRVGRGIFFQDVQEGQHHNSAMVIDREGKIRGSFDMLDPVKAAELKTLVRQLLKEKPDAAEESVATAAKD